MRFEHTEARVMNRVVVSIQSEVDIAGARIETRSLADSMGFSQSEVHSIVTSASELATNILCHACQGRLELRRVTQNDLEYLVMTAIDSGPGIENVLLAIQDGYSHNGGLGGGLPGVNRLMHEMKIHSENGCGTRIDARMFLKGRSKNIGLDEDWESIENPTTHGKIYMKREGATFVFRSG